jgi:DASH complex subunit DAM1
MRFVSTFPRYGRLIHYIWVLKEEQRLMHIQAPVAESFKRPQNHPDLGSANFNRSQGPEDMEATFLTTDTSFVENPPSSKISSKFQTPQTPAPVSKPSGIGRGRGGIPRAGRGGGGIPTRGGTTRGSRGGSGIARGAAGRGRGARA